MSKIAILSDVHSNLPALHAVLSDIAYNNTDQIFCLGDLVDFAPWTNEVIDLIKKSHISCLMGNHDERIAFGYEVLALDKHDAEETEARVAAIEFTKNTITPINKRYLAGLPIHIKLTFSLNGKNLNILLVHASARSNDEYIYEDHNIDDLEQMMDTHKAHVLVMGHTHIPYVRPLSKDSDGVDRFALNCGSVGRSKEVKAQATYILLEIDNNNMKIDIKRCDYSIHETIEHIRNSDIPNFYADFLLGVS